MDNMAILSRAAARDRYNLASNASWLLLVDFCWSGQHVRIVRNTDSVTFDAGDGLGPQAYQPCSFELANATSSTDGSLPQISLKVSNVGRLLQGAVVQYQGAVGATASIYVVSTANPAGEPQLAMQTVIMRTQTTPAWVTFTLSGASPLRQLFPKYLYYQGGPCLWLSEYKGVRCGYAGALSSCDGSFDGPNGCVAHGNNRILAFPGLGSGGGNEASVS